MDETKKLVEKTEEKICCKNIYNWSNGNVTSPTYPILNCVKDNNGNITENRLFLEFETNGMNVDGDIKKLELVFNIKEVENNAILNNKVGLYRVTSAVNTGNCSPTFESQPVDYTGVSAQITDTDKIVFDVSNIKDELFNSYKQKVVLMVMFIDKVTTPKLTFYQKTLYPTLVATYEENYYKDCPERLHTHEIGGLFNGSIDLLNGSLRFELEDVQWNGNRMPVTIKHLYNSELSYKDVPNLQGENIYSMNVGLGWSLNYIQNIKRHDIYDSKKDEHYYEYTYMNEKGEIIYLAREDKIREGESSYLYTDIYGNGIEYNPNTRILKQGDEVYQFEYGGKLEKITDKYGNFIQIGAIQNGYYVNNKINYIKDGANRIFSFAYNSDNQLVNIIIPDEIDIVNSSKILYTYSNELLTGLTYPDGRSFEFTYGQNSPSRPTAVIFKDSNGIPAYKIEYVFSGRSVISVTEYGVELIDGVATFKQGASTAYQYLSGNKTVVTTTQPVDVDDSVANTVRTVYVFNTEGDIISEYVCAEEENFGVQGEKSGINPYSSDSGVGVVSNINNLLKNHSFSSLENWNGMSNNLSTISIECVENEAEAKFGKKMLRIESTDNMTFENGVYQSTMELPAGEYTFSAYVRALDDYTGIIFPGVFLRIRDNTSTTLGQSETISYADTDFTRLSASFKLDTAKSVTAEIVIYGIGTVYVDAAQLENNNYANTYNMLTNGNFENEVFGWSCNNGITASANEKFNMNKSLCVVGDLSYIKKAYQEVAVKSKIDTVETFILSGWAKGLGLAKRERIGCNSPTYRLRAEICYSDGTVNEEPIIAEFSPHTDEWQLSSVEFSKDKYKAVSSVKIYCEFDYNVGTVYFDDIQLVRSFIETKVDKEDFNAYTATESGEEETAVTETDDEEEVSNENIDAFGNIISEITYKDGEFGAIYRNFEYNLKGNDLISETDSRNNVTLYTVDERTSRNEVVTDRLGNKTAYEYDVAGRTTKVTNKKANNEVLAEVEYSYNAFDSLTEITRGDALKYKLSYNDFHQLKSIGIDGKAENLIEYTYKNGNGRLKEITYANGDKMTVIYNGLGQIIAEKWYNMSNVLTAHYNYAYDGQGNVIRSIDNTAGKQYNYIYENGKLMQMTESVYSDTATTFSDIINTVKYYYDEQDNLVKKRVTSKDGTDRIIRYEKTENNTPLVRFYDNWGDVVSHSKNDFFGRKEFEELQISCGYIWRKFEYLDGALSEDRMITDNKKYHPTTQLVSKITLSDGRTIEYEYDAEERITKVTDSVDGVVEYTYDALGQLIRETRGNTSIGYAYDNYGNLVAKGNCTANGGIIVDTMVEYGYGNSQWRDLLTVYGGERIFYDAQGNPINYKGKTLVWEKGRQLKQYGSNTYTYNANGIRTSKTVNENRHDYILEGTKILRECCNYNQTTGEYGTVIETMYDNEDNVCGIIYNGMPYYFLKNLQNDVIAITDCTGYVVVRYTYDAWGSVRTTYDETNDAISLVNPYLYRSYYYDHETGLYYVSSRYYDPEIGRFLNSDDPMFLGLTGNIASYNLFAYCENNPVNYKDPSGYGPAGTIIGAILGFGLGALLVPRVADLLKLRGWGRKVFIALGVAALTGLGAYVGNYVGEAIFAIYKAGGAFALKINKAIANGIAKIVGGSIKAASGNGWIIKIGKFTLRIMTSGGGRTNYFRLSHATKGALTILGKYSGDRGLTHIPITFSNIIKIINLILKLLKK